MNERDRTQLDEPETTSEDPADGRQNEEPGVLPNPEAMGGVPVTLTPSGAPAPVVPPADADPKETRWPALAVAVAIAVMLLVVAMLLWI
ncbi:MAG: hypothetical protein QOJ13_832 [Gaiellales bacterium]|nr:hypothetical protein [Gaiellales bacterium]